MKLSDGVNKNIIQFQKEIRSRLFSIGDILDAYDLGSMNKLTLVMRDPDDDDMYLVVSSEKNKDYKEVAYIIMESLNDDIL